MTTIRSLAIFIACTTVPFAQAETDWHLPDVPGYHTLHCDFHTHTVLSDGDVWPTIRVAEANVEGLDCIAITDHLKHHKVSNQPEIDAGRNRSYEIAFEAAAGSDLIVIRGAELTQGMPPGHINAIFQSDNEIAHPEYQETTRRAHELGAFLFWNHPGWKSPDKSWEQDGIAIWFDEHEALYNAGLLHGIEVVNGRSYSREAHAWAIERDLTLMGNSDVHEIVALEHDLSTEHRPMTLVFAKERSVDGIRDALFDQRTAIWFENSLLGDAAMLKPLFDACVSANPVAYMERLALTTLHNDCPIDFHIELEGIHDLYNSARFFELGAKSDKGIAIKTGERLEQVSLAVRVMNLHTTPDDYLETDIVIEVSDISVDRSALEQSRTK